jgi:hypothetical protein
MGLGMHPAILYPRRSQFRPLRKDQSRLQLYDMPRRAASGVMERVVQRGVQTLEERARYTVAVFVRLGSSGRVRRAAEHHQPQENATGPGQHFLHKPPRLSGDSRTHCSYRRMLHRVCFIRPAFSPQDLCNHNARRVNGLGRRAV